MESSEKKVFTIRAAGKSYTITSSADEYDTLVQAASLLEPAMNRIERENPVMRDVQVVLFAALEVLSASLRTPKVDTLSLHTTLSELESILKQ